MPVDRSTYHYRSKRAGQAPLKKRIKAKLRDDRHTATAPNEVWAMDFVHDQLFDGRRIRLLTMIDTSTTFAPAIEVRQSFRGSDVVETLARVTEHKRSAIPKPFVSTMVPSSSARSSTSGLSCAARRSTSVVPASRQADRQCLYRVPRRVSQRQLVHDPRRGAPKIRGLA
jgi:hypothetical protein